MPLKPKPKHSVIKNLLARQSYGTPSVPGSVKPGIDHGAEGVLRG